jgi:hypothetical protein
VLHEAQDNWKQLGSLLTFVLTVLLGLRKRGGVWHLVRVIRGQWNLNARILDLEIALDRSQKDAEGERKAKEWVMERNEELRAVLKETIAATEMIEDARKKGLLTTIKPFLHEPLPPSDSSTSSPETPTGPLDLVR